MPGPGSYWIGEEERQEVLEVLASGHLSRYGDLDDPNFKHKVRTFEQEFARYCGTRHALAISSGTCAIMASAIAMELKAGDEVIVPTYGYVGSYSPLIFLGIVPVLTEIDESITIDPEDIEHRITPKTKAILPVHALGNPSDMDAVMSIAERHGLQVFEDACQAAGGVYRGRKLGTFGRAGAFSLNIFKTITAGDGGALVTNETELYEHAFAIQDQGYKPDKAGLAIGQESHLGLSFRMNELTGAVARAQLGKIDRITSTLRAKKARLKEQIDGAGPFRFRTLHDPEGECGTLCTLVFDDVATAATVAKRVGTRTLDDSMWHYYANMDHVNRHLKSLGRPSGKGAFPRTDDIMRRSVNLSVGVVDPGLCSEFGININSTDDEIDQVAERFRRACDAPAVEPQSEEAGVR